ncbi:Sorting nexin mvp1 [Tieghemiomyces parasiticus]|uniref:Sorting nexin MVP1 n=1 Tax=Tieghemiomyces parasiticus TaxID=78921 RepID=A0A9W7ZPA0_9FUNG|nr:Sorting nexin mvp1 [Tieghemiomyces parasiticus]
MESPSTSPVDNGSSTAGTSMGSPPPLGAASFSSDFSLNLPATETRPSLLPSESYLTLNPFARDDNDTLLDSSVLLATQPTTDMTFTSARRLDPPAVAELGLNLGLDLGLGLTSGRSPSVGQTAAPLANSDWMDPWSPTTKPADPAAELWASLDLGTPLVYGAAFNAALPQGGQVQLAHVRQVLHLSALPAARIEQLVQSVLALRHQSKAPSNIVTPPDEALSRAEFNLVLALLALAQKNMPATTDNLVAHRQNLPEPSLPGVDEFTVRPASPPKPRPSLAKSRIRLSRLGSWYRFRSHHDEAAPTSIEAAAAPAFSSLAMDTAGLPDGPRTPTHRSPPASGDSASLRSFRMGGLDEEDPWKTSPFATVGSRRRPLELTQRSSASFLAIRKVSSSSQLSAVRPSQPIFTPPPGPNWGDRLASSPGPTHLAFPRIVPSSPSSATDSDEVEASRPAYADTFTKLELNPVLVHTDDRKGGAVFKYVNYALTWEARGTRVLRRYSDFWWLLEVLNKRYPFRMLPSMPPKGLGSSDDKFMEKRRLGLLRFIGFLVRHPVLSGDPLVQDFLTFPDPMSTYRRRTTVTTHPEHQVPAYETIPGPDRSLPDNIDALLQRALPLVEDEIHRLTNQVLILDVVVAQQRLLAREVQRYGSFFSAVPTGAVGPGTDGAGPIVEAATLPNPTEGCTTCALPLCPPCSTMSQKAGFMQAQFETAALDLQTHAQTNTLAFQDLLKRYLDLSIAFKEVLVRWEGLTKSQPTDRIIQRLETNRGKLSELRKEAEDTIHNTPLPAHGDDLQLRAKVRKDEEVLSQLRAQTRRIAESVWFEYRLYHTSRRFTTWLYSKFARDQISHHSLALNSWRQCLLSFTYAPDSP